MSTLAEMVAAVVVHSSVAAFSGFGMTLDVAVADRPTVDRNQPVAVEQRVVARSPARKLRKVLDCPETQRARAVRA
jgi:hypothetical protein